MIFATLKDCMEGVSRYGEKGGRKYTWLQGLEKRLRWKEEGR
jgi:hypothetical protein